MARLAQIFLLTGSALILGHHVLIHSNHTLAAIISGGNCPASVSSGITKCYYIDYASGADSNSGTSESAPWKHAPGMTGVVNNVGPGMIDDAPGNKCGSNPCSYPNTGFIFKGGVVWPATVWPMTMRLEGASLSAPVYWGVDPTWYTGGAWTRPILNFGGSSGPVCNTMITFAPVQYVIWDNFEFTGLYWDHTCNGLGNGSEAYLSTNGTAPGGSYIEVKNNYIHGWSHEAYLPHNTADACDLVTGTTEGKDVGSSFHDNVVDGADSISGGYACVAIWGSPNIVYNNYFAYLANGYIGLAYNQLEEWYQNTCTYLSGSYDPTQHTQCFETNSDNGVLMYNNLFQHLQVGIDVNISTQYGYTAYFWNNVMWDTQDNSNSVVFSYPGGNTGGTFYEFNNTIEAGTDGANPSSLIVNCLSGQQGCFFRNNYIISSTAQTCGTESNCHQDHNIVQSQSAANKQGYTGSSIYPFYPPAGGSTIGAGVNLTSSSPGCGTSGLPTLCADSTVGVDLNTSNYTVIVPKRSAKNLRSANGAWDAGAYQSSGLSPASPTNLTVTSVQ